MTLATLVLVGVPWGSKSVTILRARPHGVVCEELDSIGGQKIAAS